MKRTTYIITGMLTLTLFALLSSIFFVVQRSKTKKYAVELSAEYKELSVAGVRALALMQANTPHRVYAFGTLQVVAPDAQHKPNTLYYPKDLEGYIKHTIRKDTLFVEVDFTKGKAQAESNTRYIFVDKVTMVLVADSALKDVLSYVGGLSIHAKGIVQKDICFSGKDVILVDSCRFEKASFTGKDACYTNVKIIKSQIEDAYLNLDFVEQWATEHSTMNTIHCSGRNKGGRVSADSLRVVHWEPTDEEAELNLVLKKKATVHIEY